MNKVIKRLFLVALLSSFSMTYAQDEDVKVEDENTIESNDSKKNAFTVYLGAPSIGVGYARQFNDNLSLRGKLGFFNLDVSRDNIDLNGRQVNLAGDFSYNTIDLLLDYTPFKKSSFKLVVGVSYLTKAEFEAVITPADDFTYGEIELTKDKIGNITTGADWSGIAPYVGLGFGRAVPKKKFGFGFDLGAHYVGKPEVVFDASGILLPTAAAEKAEFTDWMEKFSIIPSMVLHVNYKF